MITIKIPNGLIKKVGEDYEVTFPDNIAIPLPPTTTPPLPVPPQPPPSAGSVLFDLRAKDFPEGLVTNEYAFWNPQDPKSKQDPDIEMTSGSLFVKNGKFWSGVPDSKGTNAESSSGTHSDVFRMTLKKGPFMNYRVRLLGLRINKFNGSDSFVGVHIFNRHQTQYHLYYNTVVRQDTQIQIKRKCGMPGNPDNRAVDANGVALPGTANYGFYYDLAPTWKKSAVPLGQELDYISEIKTLPDNSVDLRTYVNGALLQSAIDNNKPFSGGGPRAGHAQILKPGQTGIRGDYCDFDFREFIVEAL